MQITNSEEAMQKNQTMHHSSNKKAILNKRYNTSLIKEAV